MSGSKKPSKKISSHKLGFEIWEHGDYPGEYYFKRNGRPWGSGTGRSTGLKVTHLSLKQAQDTIREVIKEMEPHYERVKQG